MQELMTGYKLLIACQLEARNNAVKDGNLNLILQTKLSGLKRKIGQLYSKEEKLRSVSKMKPNKAQKATMITVHRNSIVKVYLVIMRVITVKLNPLNCQHSMISTGKKSRQFYSTGLLVLSNTTGNQSLSQHFLICFLPWEPILNTRPTVQSIS